MAKDHPAVYTDVLLPVFTEMLEGTDSVLDPMAGTGKLHLIRGLGYTGKIFLSELQPKWAKQGKYTHTNVVVGNALYLPFKDGAVDAICVSPVFGCRLSDHHNAQDGSRRYGYQFQHGSALHHDNAGLLQWGEKYRKFHIEAWNECFRVVRRRFVLDMKDHYRKRVIQPVSDWHVGVLEGIGWTLKEHVKVTTPGNRDGANADLRMDYHNVYLFEK